ncbi:MAG: MFS transporter [Immundisolibacterales bacterium]|nr:MFS transporter [Immundisolibacterales bacterium]
MWGLDPAAFRRSRNPWLTDRRFVAIFVVGTLTSVVRWLEMLVFGVYVFAETRSATITAAMTLLRVLPLALFGAFGGAVADRVDRRLVMQWGLVAMCVLSVGLAVLAWSGRIEVWHLGVAAFLGGTFWITDFPIRRALIGDVVPGAFLGRAMGVDTLANNGTRILGPLLGGTLLATVGLAGVFVLSAVLHAMCWIAFQMVRFPSSGAAARTDNVWRSIAEGMRYLRGNRRLAGVLAMTVVFNLWAFPVVAMIPVIGEESFRLGPSAVGILASTEGAGALIGSILVTILARPANFMRIYFWGCVVYLALSMAFAASPFPWLAGTMLFVVGVGGAFYAAMQTTLVITSTPAAVRGRMMGVLSVCIGTGPLGFYHVGALADWIGARDAVALIGLEGLVAAIVVSLLWPEIHGRRPGAARLRRQDRRRPRRAG